LAFEFFKFLSWTALWAWVLSDTAFRYVIPKIDKFYDTLDKIAKTNTREGVFRFLLVKTIVMFIRLFAIMCLTYLMASWSAWCVLRRVLYTKGLETKRWLFFISGYHGNGGICCPLVES